jgi:hypothetical protein
MRTFIADFETTTKEEDCRVWAYAICEVGNENNIEVGNKLDDFMKWCRQKENFKVMFHNLKFDGQFILQWLFRNGFEHVTEPRDKKSGTFTTLISDKGMYYQIEVYFEIKGKHVNKVTFQDSLKLIPLSVDSIAKSFKMPIQKLEIDYTAHDELPEGVPLTDIEKEYIIHDVKIVARAVEYFYSQGLKKMTIGSCALDEYKKLVSKKSFERWYPTPKYHADVKQSYKGGFTYLNPKFKGKIIKEGVVFDVNSLYPSVMRYEYLPFGTPIFYKGEYKKDILYPLYVQMIRCQFQIKKGKIPTIQIKHSRFFNGNEYLLSSGDSEQTLCLTSIDLKLFFEHYDVYNLEYISGWKFKSSKGLFDKYIDKWSENKINAKKEGNHGLYLISKLFLNSLYGKFGTDTEIAVKVPYLDTDGVVRFYDQKEEDREGVYVAMASFITSYARLKTISSAQVVMDNYNSGKSKIEFVYADTDSLHLKSDGHELPEGLDIDTYRLGAWKYESKFNKAKFLRQKCYMENSTEDIENPVPDYELKITVAGMPKSCHQYVTFNNFKIGAEYKGKIQPKRVKGGVILEPIDFSIKE